MNKVLDKNELEKIIKLKMPNSDDYDGAPTRYSPSEVITIPEGYEEIERCLFEKVYGLKTINLPATLKVINRYAFYNCRDLKRINCPAKLVEVKHYAFASCFNLKDINMNMDVPFEDIICCFNGGSIPIALRSYKLASVIDNEIFSTTFISKNSMSETENYVTTTNGLKKLFVSTQEFKQ